MALDLNAAISLLLPLRGTTQTDLKRVDKGTGPLSFTRATTATRLNPDTNLIESVASGDLREDGRQYLNRFSYSEDFSQSNWVKSNATVASGNATAPNGKAVAQSITASAGNGTCLQAVTDTSRARYGSIYLKRKTGTGDIQVTLDGGATWTTVAVTAAWTRLGAGQTLANPSFGVRIVTSGDAVYAWGAQLEDAAAATRYKKSSSSPAYAPRGVLIEGQRTNLLTYSEQFDNAAWGVWGSGLVVTVNQIASPDGTSTADKLQCNNAGGGLHQAQSIPSDALSRTFSIFLKAGSSPTANIGLVYSGGTEVNAQVSINFGTGVLSVVQGTPTYGVVPHADGWFRVWIEKANNSSNTTIYPIIFLPNGYYAYSWGAQLEQATFPSSYIPTTSAAVTRNADELTMPSSGNISDSVGSIFAVYDSIHTASSNDGILGSLGGSTRFQTSIHTDLRLFDGTNYAIIAVPTSYNISRKGASRWGGSEMNVFSGITNTPTTFDGSMNYGTNLKIGGFSGACERWGHIKGLIIFNRALSDAEMIAITS